MEILYNTSGTLKIYAQTLSVFIWERIDKEIFYMEGYKIVLEVVMLSFAEEKEYCITTAFSVR